MSKWKFQSFSHTAGRRASHLVYEFLNKFDIEYFTVIQSTGEVLDQRIEIVYIDPPIHREIETEDQWIEYLEELKGGKD